MRNLKKILALALALVMTLSLMTVANAFTDSEKIEADYAESIAVLAGMGVFEGYEDGSFKPQGDITRAEVAAIVYRLATGDVADKNVGIHKDHARFDDVTASHWAAGYIGYCANAQLIKGYGDGNFGPKDKVTGYQALAMILRAVGYDVNGEFTGEGWEVEVAEVATDLGLLSTIKESLGKAATREMIAEILFQTATKAYIVKWTNAFGYQPVALPASTTQGMATNIMNTLGLKNFNLQPATKTDDWGRPSYGYTYSTGDKATFFAVPAANTYTVATSECSVAIDMKLKQDKVVDLWVNGVKYTREINIADVAVNFGGQGILIEVYSDRVVLIDTYLAQVGAGHKAVVDAGGHELVPAYTDILIYTADTANTAVGTAATLKGLEYTAGQYVLVNRNLGKGYTVAVGVAPSVTGAQTVIWQNSAKHTVNGTTYNDAVYYCLDQAGNTANANFTWFFDQYGNLIGSASIKTVYDYATIANIQWVNPLGSTGYATATLVYTNGTTESVVVKAIDQDADWKFTTAGEVLSYTLFQGDYETGAVSANYGYNAEFIGQKLFAVSKDANGVAYLSEIKTVVTADVTKGNPVVAGACYIDDNTQFLVRTTVGGAYTWTPVTGYNQITSLKGAYVAYVNLDGDAAAEVVYMYGAPATTAAANLVYIVNDSYSWVAGTADYITLGGAQIKGEAATVVVNKEWLDGAGTELKVGSLYYMVDANGDGKVNALAGETVTEVTAAGVALADGSTAKVVAAGSYKILANALEVTGEVVPYNITGVTPYGTWTGAENIVIVYKNYTVSAIYVVK